MWHALVRFNCDLIKLRQPVTTTMTGRPRRFLTTRRSRAHIICAWAAHRARWRRIVRFMSTHRWSATTASSSCFYRRQPVSGFVIDEKQTRASFTPTTTVAALPGILLSTNGKNMLRNRKEKLNFFRIIISGIILVRCRNISTFQETTDSSV